MSSRIDRNLPSPEKRFGARLSGELVAAVWFFLGSLMSAACLAAPSEEVVQAMARATTLSPDEIRRDYDSCDSGVTGSMKICASYLWTEQDLRLNRAYTTLQVRARQRGYEVALVDAQKAWLKYRDLACEFEGGMGAGGGTAEGLFILGCKEELTRQRAERLEAWVRDGQ